jgi:preprotein translocase subunit SecE
MKTTTVAPDSKGRDDAADAGGASYPPHKAGGGAPSPRPGGGMFRQYKPEMGRYTRTGTFIGLLALIVWGAVFLDSRLSVYEGTEFWRLLITPGISIAVAVILSALAWRYTFAHPRSSDFMIATEGEMKKVSWSTRREIIGSTKVVILFTVLMAAYLFVVDLVFQGLFSAVGVLKK